MKRGEKILRKHLPAIEKNVVELGDKEMTEEVAETVSEKAEKILAQNFKGKKLEKMKLQLSKTMKDLQSNRSSKHRGKVPLSDGRSEERI